MRPCPSFPGYSATEVGRIFSHRRGKRLPGQHGGKGSYIDPSYMRELRGSISPKGYRNVGIRVGEGRSRPVGVHQLVADAFLGPCPPGMEVRHLDGCHTNNAVSNLAYGTPRDNAKDRQRHGRYHGGSRHHGAKLTREQVHELLQRRAQGAKVRELANQFAVSVSTVEAILYGKAYVKDAIEFKRVQS